MVDEILKHSILFAVLFLVSIAQLTPGADADCTIDPSVPQADKDMMQKAINKLEPIKNSK